jgi:uncharacterized protein YbjT (DUF2867 family)
MSMASSLAMGKPTLVVGATGKVGRLVVRKLLATGATVHALVRDSGKASELLPSDSRLKLFCGDLHSEAAMREAVRGCRAVIAVSGTTRLSKPKDFVPWRFFGNDPMSWCDDYSHPYFVNFLGIRRLASVAEAEGATKFVRLTGLTIGLPVYNPVSVLFNLLLSLTGKWHSMAEQYLRGSRLNYTIIRPGGLSDDTREGFPEGEVSLQLEAIEERENRDDDDDDDDANDDGTRSSPVRGKSKPPVISPPARIGRADLAALCVACTTSEKASCRTLACRWVGEGLQPVSQGRAADGSASWEEEFEKLSKPRSEKACSSGVSGKEVVAQSRPFATAVAAAVPLVFTLILQAAALLKFSMVRLASLFS